MKVQVFILLSALNGLTNSEGLNIRTLIIQLGLTTCVISGQQSTTIYQQPTISM